MSTILAGFTFWFSGGATIFENIPKAFTFVGAKSFLRIPLLSIIMLLLTVIFWFIMRHTAFGRKLYAIGGNVSAAKVSGINVKKYKNLAFALCAALASLTGVMMASRLGSAHPTGGDGLFLQSYAAVFLGRTVFKEGVPNIWGTFIGAAILGILQNGLTIMQVPTFMQDLLTGCIIILAVVFQKIGRGDSK
jgi:ribose transport system permease protein